MTGLGLDGGFAQQTLRGDEVARKRNGRASWST